MQMRMLLVAAVLVGAVARESHAGTYVVQVDEGLPSKTVGAFSRSAPAQYEEDLDSLPGSAQSKDRTWRWQADGDWDHAPTYWLKGTAGWDEVTVTADTAGYGSRAHINAKYEASLSSRDPATMTGVTEQYLVLNAANASARDMDGLKTGTIEAPEWGPVLMAFQAPPQNPTGANRALTVVGRLLVGVESSGWDYRRGGDGPAPGVVSRAAVTRSVMHIYGGYLNLTPNF